MPQLTEFTGERADCQEKGRAPRRGGLITLNSVTYKVKILLGELQAGEVIAIDEAGVDADFIRKDKGLFEGGMAENHPAAKIFGGGDEFPPDPVKI